jgi:hypothetical protein
MRVPWYVKALGCMETGEYGKDENGTWQLCTIKQNVTKVHGKFYVLREHVRQFCGSGFRIKRI